MNTTSSECATKERYATHAQAMRIVGAINARSKRSKRRHNARAFRCARCSGWHLYRGGGMARTYREHEGAA